MYRPNYRVCVDTKQDLEVMLKLYDFFREKLIEVSYQEIIELLDQNPEIAIINQSVKQKHFEESKSGIGQ